MDVLNAYLQGLVLVLILFGFVVQRQVHDSYRELVQTYRDEMRTHVAHIEQRLDELEMTQH
jgi:hypothetical protein